MPAPQPTSAKVRATGGDPSAAQPQNPSDACRGLPSTRGAERRAWRPQLLKLHVQVVPAAQRAASRGVSIGASKAQAARRRSPVLEEAVGVQLVKLIPIATRLRLQPVDLSLSAAHASAAKDAAHATAAVSLRRCRAFQRNATRLRQRLLLRRPARLHCGTRGGTRVVSALAGGSPVTRPQRAPLRQACGLRAGRPRFFAPVAGVWVSRRHAPEGQQK